MIMLGASPPPNSTPTSPSFPAEGNTLLQVTIWRLMRNRRRRYGAVTTVRHSYICVTNRIPRKCLHIKMLLCTDSIDEGRVSDLFSFKITSKYFFFDQLHFWSNLCPLIVCYLLSQIDLFLQRLQKL